MNNFVDGLIVFRRWGEYLLEVVESKCNCNLVTICRRCYHTRTRNLKYNYIYMKICN